MLSIKLNNSENLFIEMLSLKLNILNMLSLKLNIFKNIIIVIFKES